MPTAISRLRPGPRFDPDFEIDVQYALFDFDDTLVHHNSPELPTPRFIAACHETGKRALLGGVTGRQFLKAEHVIRASGMSALSIVSNGAQIFSGRDWEMVVERTLPNRATRSIVGTLQNLGIEHWIQDDGWDHRWLSDDPYSRVSSKDLGKYIRPMEIWQPVGTSNQLLVPAYEPVKPFIIVAHGVVAEQFKQLEDIGREYNEQQVSSYVAHEYTNPSGPSTFDYFFIDSRANKFEALRLVAEMSDVPLVNTMVTDDGINGAIIVENAGIGVAMGNATEQTKRVATFIAPNVGDNGAAIALEELVLHKFTG